MSDAAIERFFETYAERYMASDVDAVAAMYEAPFLRFERVARSTCTIARLSGSILLFAEFLRERRVDP